MNAKTPQTHVIRDLDTLRVVSDPLRAQIFELCAAQARTVREIAGLLGLAPTRLYYHFNLLEKHGLIGVADTRTIGNLIEKSYRSVAANLDFDRELLNFDTHQGKENAFSMVRSVLDSTRDDLLRSMEARAEALAQGAAHKHREVELSRLTVHLSDERASDFLERFKALTQEFEEAEAPDGQVFALTLAFYPVFYYPGEASSPMPA